MFSKDGGYVFDNNIQYKYNLSADEQRENKKNVRVLTGLSTRVLLQNKTIKYPDDVSSQLQPYRIQSLRQRKTPVARCEL